MDEAQRNEFLEMPRLAILMLNRDPAPIGVPVWFEWNGRTVEMFAMSNSPKIGRIERDPNASVLVTNAVGEPEAWVAFDGTTSITHPGGMELVARLADRYWDLTQPGNRAALEGWQQAPEAMCQLSLTPTRIRSG